MVFYLVWLLESHPAVVGTARKIQALHLLYCPQPFIVPFLKQNGFMLLHRLVIPLRSSLFFQCRSRLVHKIEWPILLRTLDSIIFQECNVKPGMYVSGRNFKEGLSVFCTLFWSCSFLYLYFVYNEAGAIRQ